MNDSFHLAQLPIEIRKQVEDYIEFLLQKYGKGKANGATENPRLKAYGRYAGQINMTDDFDAPLADFQDYQ